MQQQSTEQPLAVTAFLRKQSQEILRASHVEPGSTQMDPKKPPGTAGQQIGKLTTNVYRLDPQDKNARVFQYEVKVEGIGQNATADLDLTQRTNSDYRNAERRFYCHLVMGMFKRSEPNIVSDGYTLYYDLARILYSKTPLSLPKEGRDWVFTAEQIYQIDSSIPVWYRAYRLTIKPAEKNPIILSDISLLSADAAAIDRSREQFLDIATSQEVFDRQTGDDSYVNYSVSSYYLMNPDAFGFGAADCPELKGNASFLGIGVNKGVRPIQAPNNDVTSGLVVAVKKSSFHINQEQTMYQKAEVLLNNVSSDEPQLKDRLERHIKGIYVQTIYSNPQTFEIDGLTAFNANDHRFMAKINGRESLVTVAEYYRLRYGIILAHPEMPLIIRKRPTGPNYYPMEVVRVLDNQRVKGDQQIPAQLADMIKKTAVPPAVLSEQNLRLKDSLHLQDSAYLRNIGLRFEDHPIEPNARVLPAPQIQFGQNVERPKVPASNWDGRNATYVVPATCKRWVAIGFESRERPPFTEQMWKDFVAMFERSIGQRGMQYPKPDIRFQRIPGEHQLKDFIKSLAVDEGFEYALIAHSGDSFFHNDLKLYERKTEMVIQGVKVQTVKRVLELKQMLTVDNLVHKANVKMGGLNYAIIPPEPALKALFGTDTMFLGIATNHPGGGFGGGSTVENLDLFPGDGDTPGKGPNGNQIQNRGPNGSRNRGPNGNRAGRARRRGASSQSMLGPDHPRPNPPSVVGFAANFGKNHPNELIGDFCYQPPLREEKVSIISDIAQYCAQKFHENRQKFPQRIVIYRNGCSEGMFEAILKFEVALMKAALSAIGCTAKITVIVANKLQSVRLYAQRINRQARVADQNIQPGTVVDTGIVHPKWNEFFMGSHRSGLGTLRNVRYTVLLDENNMSMDNLEMMTHHLCFQHQIVFSPTSLPSPVYIALEYAKRGRNQFNSWADKLEDSALPTRYRDHAMLTEHLSYQGTRYLKHLRVNA